MVRREAQDHIECLRKQLDLLDTLLPGQPEIFEGLTAKHGARIEAIEAALDATGEPRSDDAVAEAAVARAEALEDLQHALIAHDEELQRDAERRLDADG